MASQPQSSPAPPDGPARRGPFRKRLEVALVAAALIHPLAWLGARLDWRLDLFTHFREPAAALTAAAFALKARRRPRLAIALAGLAVVQVAPLFRYHGPNPVPADPRPGARLRILMANVLAHNWRHAELARLIRREQPDVVGLVEYTKDWAEGLADLRREFPYRLEAPREAKGLALWFRRPPTTLEPPRRLSPESWPLLHATFDFAGRERHLWLVHPSSPFRRRGHPELMALAAHIRDAGGSRIVVGDLNSSDGSPRFADFVATTGLRDSRLGYGRQPSWPVWLPYRIPIDHAFVSADLAVVARRLGPPIGSDHLPLIVDLAPASAGAANRSASSRR